ncbi:MAG: alpha/beta fold hydrolase [Chitinophagales bacterium]
MKSIAFISLFFLHFSLFAQQKISTIYLLSGLGSDERIFKNLSIDTQYNIIYLPYSLPLENETIERYAGPMAEKVDTTEAFAIIGVSLGGIIAVEMTEYIHPEKVFLLSSVSSSDQVPGQYAFYAKHNLHKTLPAWMFKYSTFLLQPLYEPERKAEKVTCNAMIKQKDALFMKRATAMLVNWKRTEEENNNITIIQIHGSADNTLPVENIQADHIIEGGSHMMTLIHAGSVSEIINTELAK